MGAGATWVADTFSWQTIAENTLKAYEWVLGGGKIKAVTNLFIVFKVNGR